jgi:hypothetical protein
MTIKNNIVRIAPSDISFLANCPHCLWHKYHTGLKHGSTFPGVFSILDISQKNYFNPLGTKEISSDLPDGEVDLKIADKFITSKVLYDLEGRSFQLGGKADLILKFNDGTYGVIDNKTTKIKDSQDYYFYQLECYATILEYPDASTSEKFFSANGVDCYSPVTHLGLSMFEPSKIIDHSKETITQLYARKWQAVERNPKKLLEKITSIMDIISAPECPDASSCDRCKLYLNALEAAK